VTRLNNEDSPGKDLETSSQSTRPDYLAKVAARLAALKEHLMAEIPRGIQEITWEVGSGHGHFLNKYAAVNPGRFFVGIDLLGDRLRKASKKQTAAGTLNLRFVKAEALEFLECLPTGIRISEVIVLFPDPWPKKRHFKHRLVQPIFLDRLASRMTLGGRLYFRTDHGPYVEWAREQFNLHRSWSLIPEPQWILEEKTVFQARAPSFGSLVAELKTPTRAGTPTD
jgi:tRNA (guanine-N7-)-methyltransferase